MSNLQESPVWVDEIYQLTDETPVLGKQNNVPGGGPSNLQAEQLANRTAFLKQGLDIVQSGEVPFQDEGSAREAILQNKIPEGAVFSIRSTNNLFWVEEFRNIAGEPVATGKRLTAQEYIDGLIKRNITDSPVISFATKDGFSVCSFYVNDATGDIELHTDKIPQVNADAVNLSGVTLARSDSGILSFQDSNGLDLDLVDLIAQIAGESVVTTGDTAALLSADAAAYIAQNYNLKRHPV
ncbi:TPA: hypothetical protein MJB25_08150, partial [Klebsiella pneumoniae]|nr:hypothetical protein [Klebsiella pneumoniae]HBZ0476387.1 hypothetical protein [Klebsiella pneumoniae]